MMNGNLYYGHLIDEYLEERAKVWKGATNDVYSAEMLFKLAEMARYDVYPNGKFSDEECNLWSLFRR